jgi:hypothetical protein
LLPYSLSPSATTTTTSSLMRAAASNLKLSILYSLCCNTNVLLFTNLDSHVWFTPFDLFLSISLFSESSMNYCCPMPSFVLCRILC